MTVSDWVLIGVGLINCVAVAAPLQRRVRRGDRIDAVRGTRRSCRDRAQMAGADHVIDGKTLIGWGFEPGPWFREALEVLNAAARLGTSEDVLKSLAAEYAPKPMPRVLLRDPGSVRHVMNIRAETPEEVASVEAVDRHMTELMRLPTVVAGAVMPDACPAGSAPGTIPVGGIVATKGTIHPGMHSEDIWANRT